VQFHGALCDGESDTGASSVRVSRVIDAVKRQEDSEEVCAGFRSLRSAMATPEVQFAKAS
jgi:hypothetical protein